MMYFQSSTLEKYQQNIGRAVSSLCFLLGIERNGQDSKLHRMEELILAEAESQLEVKGVTGCKLASLQKELALWH